MKRSLPCRLHEPHGWIPFPILRIAGDDTDGGKNCMTQIPEPPHPNPFNRLRIRFDSPSRTSR